MHKYKTGTLILIGFLILVLSPAALCASAKTIYVAGDGSGTYNCDSIDDNVQIQQALDYANSYPGTVVHLKGPFTYQISKQMTIGSYTTLEGDSTAKMKIKANAGWSNDGDSFDSDGHNAMLHGKSSGVHDITFQGFEMDGNFDNQGGLSHGQGYFPAVILQTGCYNITFQNMYAHNFGDDVLRVYYSTPIDSSNKGNIIFRNNKIYKSGHEGLYVIGCNNVQFYNNDVYTWADCAIRPVCCNHVKIYNNNLHSEYSGQASGALIELQRNDADGITNDVEIYNNTMHTTVGVGVYMHGKDSSGVCSGRNVWIHNNIFYNTGQYDWFGTIDSGDVGGYTQKGIIVGYWNNTTIENNVFDNAGSGVIYSGSNCDGNYFSSNVYTTIRNNIFYNTQYIAGRAIEIYDTHQHFNVFYNDFYTNKVNFYGSTITQSNNYFVDPKFADATSYDYQLLATSPCIGAGLNGEDMGAFTNQKIIPLPINIKKSTPTIIWTNPADITYGTALSGIQLNAVASVLGTYVYTPTAGTILSVGTHTLHVDFTPTDAANYNTASKDVIISVTSVQKTTPTITWSNPATITNGTALSKTQLNAVASVPGTFVYNPTAGTILSVGTHTLHVDFTPTDAANYNTASKAVIINVTSVQKTTPTITWSNPANITNGTALSKTQLNAIASVPGTFVYNPTAGTILSVGTHTLHVDFTPTNAANYNTASKAVTINVSQPRISVFPSYTKSPTDPKKRSIRGHQWQRLYRLR